MGRFRSTRTAPSSLRCRKASGMYLSGSNSSCSRNTPSRVILPFACRSALHETPMPMGSEAPWRGRRITRTSSAKYLPPNCAPMPHCWADSSNCASSSRSRNARPCALPVVGKCVEILRRGQLHGLHRRFGRRAADHERQVVRRAGGRAEVTIFCVRNSTSALGFSTARVSWNR